MLMFILSHHSSRSASMALIAIARLAGRKPANKPPITRITAPIRQQ